MLAIKQQRNYDQQFVVGRVGCLIAVDRVATLIIDH
jgi:hypothetical protein